MFRNKADSFLSPEEPPTPKTRRWKRTKTIGWAQHAVRDDIITSTGSEVLASDPELLQMFPVTVGL